MATSFGSTELGLWSLASAVNSFTDPRQLQRTSPEVERYNEELSDIERLTSSCSPDSVGQPHHIRNTVYSPNTPSQSYPLPSPGTVYSPDCLNCTNAIHSDVRTDWLASPKYRKLRSFDGQTARMPGIPTEPLRYSEVNNGLKEENRECDFPTTNQDSANDLSSKQLLKQNGGHESGQRTAHNSNTSTTSCKTSEGPIKNLNKAFKSAEKNYTEPKEYSEIPTPSRHDIQHSPKHKFGTSDAVEVLLGLSEGFFHKEGSTYNDNNNSSNLFHEVPVESSARDCKTQTSIPVASNDITDHKAKTDNVVIETSQRTNKKQDIPLTPVKDDIANTFNFKKAFCRKFAQSLDHTLPHSTPENEEKIAAFETKNPDVGIKNGGSEPSRTFNKIEAMSSREKRDSFEEHKNTTDLNKDTNNDTDLIHSKHHRPSNESTNLTRKEQLQFGVNSNLYRNFNEAESSTESICDSDQENDDVSESGSSSDYSSDSQEEDVGEKEKISIGIVEERSRDALTKKPSFVLSKPKFSLPSKSSIASKKPPTFGFMSNFQTSKAAEKQRYLNLDKQLGGGSTKDADTRITCDTIPPTFSPKHGFKIKKATFTFSGQGKADGTASKPKRLNVTSQSHVMGDCALVPSRVLNKAPLGFVAGKSKPAEFRFLSQNFKPQSTFLSESSSATFGAFIREVSFEKLSSTAKETCRTNSDLARNKQIKSKAKTRYDHRRLPRPNARSPALEAQSIKSRKRGSFEPQKQISPAKKRKLIAHSGKSLLSGYKDTSSNDSDSSFSIGSKCHNFSQKAGKSTEFGSHKGEIYFPNSDDFDIETGSRNGTSHFKRNLTRCESWSTDSISSSRTSSVCGEIHQKNSTKKSHISPRKKHRRKKLHRECAKIKHSDSQERKLKRSSLISPRSNRSPVAHVTTEPGGRKETLPYKHHSPPPSKFNILSSVPPAASLKPGPIRGELKPGYWTNSSKFQSLKAPVTGWQLGQDATELKQKRQRCKWRNMNLSMFCMGGAT